MTIVGTVSYKNKVINDWPKAVLICFHPSFLYHQAVGFSLESSHMMFEPIYNLLVTIIPIVEIDLVNCSNLDSLKVIES